MWFFFVVVIVIFLVILKVVITFVVLFISIYSLDISCRFNNLKSPSLVKIWFSNPVLLLESQESMGVSNIFCFVETWNLWLSDFDA